ncbi:MAG TPA: hypothetical protein VJJ26_02125 [Candidatus Babeliales bacterium]|nr:hypothetical protein [Candidatus Babeliales bacterium]
MKKILLYLTVLTFVISLSSNNFDSASIQRNISWQDVQRLQEAARARDILTSEERLCFNCLCQNYKDDPLFYKTKDIDFINYALENLSKHIRILENDSRPENIHKEKIAFTIAGLIPAMLLMYMGGFDATFYLCRKHWELISGKFEDIYIPSKLFEGLSSEKFSLKEKRYLKRFSVEKIVSWDYGIWHYNNSTDKDREKTATKLSHRNKEKLKYSALRYEVNQHKTQLKSDLLCPIIILLGAIACGLPAFYSTLYCAETTAEKLKLARKLYKLFKEEKEHRFSFSQKSI